MTAAEEALLDRLEAVLPALHVLVRGKAVLDDVQAAAGLRTRRSSSSAAAMSGMVHMVHVDNAASKLSSGNGSVAASTPARWTGCSSRAEPLGGKLPADHRRLDSGHPLDGLGVVGDVQARAEADFDDFAREPFAHTATLRVRHLHVAHDIDDPRHDLLPVGAHAC